MVKIYLPGPPVESIQIRTKADTHRVTVIINECCVQEHSTAMARDGADTWSACIQQRGQERARLQYQGRRSRFLWLPDGEGK